MFWDLPFYIERPQTILGDVVTVFIYRVALKVYLNERVFEPRERDYALVGSFYAFSILLAWALFRFRTTKNVYTSSNGFPIVGLFSLLCVPVLLASQNWDDHDRSGRYTAQSTAKAYLDSVEEDVDAMIFTIGDNDTFAIWYAQEIEGYRTDVRSIILNCSQQTGISINSNDVPTPALQSPHNSSTVSMPMG